ncbi:hybrid sensor histidine kinase/response regulator [Nitrincola tapanii]|uniref:histidine kinase n=1 Tax=Nitrincola tapanii TaxID=1708751 RepID=A0A5A9W1D4_9GAMM|nr:hybrid sensor histidine kinase/response regulator [Nitrincola tapanii]KAA0874600.1 sensor histidine kinase [Nitrincola tapanii]
MKGLHHTSIRQRVLFLSLVPMLIITTILGGYFTVTKLADSKEALLDKGAQLTRLLAAAAEFGILSSNPSELAPLSQRLIREALISDVIFYNDKKEMIYREASFSISTPEFNQEVIYQDEIWYFVRPVFITYVQLDQNPEFYPKEDEGEIIGWVAILISDKPIIQRQLEILLRSLLIIAIGFLLTFLIASLFGRRITEPISGLSEIIFKLQRGDLGARATRIATDELNTLGQGINQLASTVQEANRELESRIQQATYALKQSLANAEVTNRDLIDAQEKAKKANQAKDAFLARMSHELRTPLTSVIGFTQMLKMDLSEKERNQYIGIIDQTSKTLLSLIDDVLDFSRLQSEAIKIESILFDPNELIFRVLEMHAPSAHSKSIELHCLLPQPLPNKLKGDPTRLRQILTNLLGNAIKFTAQGEVCLNLDYDLEQGKIHLKIQDTGIGIREEFKANLFEAFFQADSSISRRYGGSGLGLAIVARLVNLMKGEIHFTSQEGKGTEFIVSLPLELAESKPVFEVPSHLNIAVLDQDPTSRLSLGYLLKEISDRVAFFPNAKEFVDSTYIDYSHILVNLMAREFNSKNLNILLRQLKLKYKSSEIILLSPSDVHIELKHSHISALPKPVEPKRLYQHLHLDVRSEISYQHSVEKSLPKPIKVLLAEDNDFNRLLASKTLAQLGAEVIECANGKEAVVASKTHQPSLILMDINMPEMDGIQASALIRQALSSSRIVALTANLSAREEQALADIGISEILYKPLDNQKLFALLKETYQTVYGETLNSYPEVSVPAVTDQALQDELEKRLLAIQQQIHRKDWSALSSELHQLQGIAGLYDQPELEQTVHELMDVLQAQDCRGLWKLFQRLERILRSNH